jgi:hypothetical protein
VAPPRVGPSDQGYGVDELSANFAYTAFYKVGQERCNKYCNRVIRLVPIVASVVALYNSRRGLRSLALQLERSLPMATSAPLQSAAPQRGIKALLARYPLVSFFVMAYAFSWIVCAPWVLGEDGANVLPPALSVPSSSARLLLAGGILAGPTLSAFIMTATTEGRACATC